MKIKSTLLALAGLGFLANAAMGAVTIETGSLAVAFYQVIGGVTQANTYMYDLGAASLWRENTQTGLVSTINTNLSSSNIASDLNTAFGGTWANDGTVRWMVIGNIDSTSTVSGDNARTSYLSRASSVAEAGPNTTWTTLSTSRLDILTNNLNPVLTNRVNATSASNPDGTIVPTSAAADPAEFLPPNSTSYFGLPSTSDPTQTLGAGTIGGSAYEGVLDVYRALRYTASADLTSGFGGTYGAVGTGQFIGTFALDSAGNLSVIPEPSGALALGVIGTLAGLGYRRRRNA